MYENEEILADRESYLTIWKSLIYKVIQDYQERFMEVAMVENAMEYIWEEYCRFNYHCKAFYMQDANEKLDRHKVCACYMLAILKANVLSCRFVNSDREERYLSLNENLAITVGMSLLRAFILRSIDSNEKLTDEQKNNYKCLVDNGIVFPECNHGVYRENFAAELHHTRTENNYNILSLANTLYLLELHTLQTEAVHKQEKKNTKKEKKSKK